ncbi:hypothetical protein niasHS_013762 [Heterodera schachtii]|uniref:Multicopper oxidase n=1 Tax=Heterodera schachtii TaxID=97005 RepID=A0ABD2J456_HETSC
MARPNEDGIYEFDLTIEHGMTMVTTQVDGITPIIDYSPEQLVWTKRDPDFHSKCNKNDTFIDGSENIEKMDQQLSTLIQYDGKHRRVITVNGKSPGDPIVVPFGAKVVIRVRNRLITQAITLHMHGMSMKNRWWNDGVPYVQQCPITPGSVYTYNFIADNPGTHFYHGHMMGDRSMGLLGGFVVIRPDERIEFTTEFGDKIKIGRQNLAILQMFGKILFMNELNGLVIALIRAGPPQAHGPYLGFLRQFSVLVNQKGWHSQDDLKLIPSRLPLPNFAIKRGENLLLRLINGGFEQSFYVWVEEHEFWVVAVDGSYVKPKRFDSVLIHPGERYDLLIVSHQNPTRNFFRIIFESFDRFMGNFSTGEDRINVGLANLIYEDQLVGNESKKLGNFSNEVDWGHKKCTNQSNCLILNCPHIDFITRPRNYTCITIDHLENAEMPSNDDAIIFQSQNFPANQFHELMLNVMPSFNRWFYKMPKDIPFFNQGSLERIATKCDKTKCNRSENRCHCFHHFEFTLDNIVQITVATSMNMLHPFHLHGIKFYVLKVGTMEPEYGLNSDVKCADEDCLEMKWSNISYSNGNIPHLKKNPILRDTVMVPHKGYVVIRFRATNAGWFFAHCHMLFHHMDGMAFAYKVDAAPSAPSKMPKPPSNFPRNCAFFDGGVGWDDDENEEDEAETKNGQSKFGINISMLLFLIGFKILFHYL